MPVDFEVIERLDKDLKEAARTLGAAQARYLTDLYYEIQEFRKASGNQKRALKEGEEPNRLIDWLFESMMHLEDDIRKALDVFTSEWAIGRWMKSITGIGPVIAAGLLSHLDIRKARTVGHIWRFAGLDPTVRWEKGQKRPWNASLKTLCWKAGESFIKFQNNKNDFYGKHFLFRKAQEMDRNNRGAYAELAKFELERFKVKKDTKKYPANMAGRLHDGHINDRARRWATKLFLSHVHHAMYMDFYGENPPVPFSFERCNADHRHFIDLPNWPWEGGGRPLRELLAASSE